MARSDLGPDHDLAKRLSDLEKQVRGLTTRDVLPNSAMPVPVGAYVITEDAALTSGSFFVDVPVPVPFGKSKVIVTAIANLFFVGNAGGTSILECYIEANGFDLTWSSPVFVATKATQLGGIGNSATGALGFQQDGVTGFTVSLAIYPSVPAEFPANANNFASLTVIALFYE